MAIEEEQSYKYSLMAGLLFALIWIVFCPISLAVYTIYEAHLILRSRKLGVSATALGPMTMRWLQHQLGLRRDEACAKLIKVVPNHCYAGLYAASFPVLLGHRLTGFVPKMLRYPYEGVPPIGHMNGMRVTFVDAAIERYLPGVDQFVELGAGYDCTYLFPGIRKVVQAAGRVIRTPDDQGTVHLIDDRFMQPQVQRLLPAWWRLGDEDGTAMPSADAPVDHSLR